MLILFILVFQNIDNIQNYLQEQDMVNIDVSNDISDLKNDISFMKPQLRQLDERFQNYEEECAEYGNISVTSCCQSFPNESRLVCIEGVTSTKDWKNMTIEGFECKEEVHYGCVKYQLVKYDYEIR